MYVYIEYKNYEANLTQIFHGNCIFLRVFGRKLLKAFNQRIIFHVPFNMRSLSRALNRGFIPNKSTYYLLNYIPTYIIGFSY